MPVPEMPRTVALRAIVEENNLLLECAKVVVRLYNLKPEGIRSRAEFLHDAAVDLCLEMTNKNMFKKK